MKYCAKCGAELSENSKFCEKCGNKVNENFLNNRNKRVKSGKIVAVIVVAAIIAAAGYLQYTESQKDSNLSKDARETLRYVILEEHEIPQEFLSIIEEKKMNVFKLTYTDKNSLYIAVGYGEQQTGGYSICVNQCYQSQNAIYFDTTLVGPSKGDQIHQADLCPYLVIKTEYLEKSVVFE